MNENFTTAKGQVNCIEKDGLNITAMHRSFGDIRGRLDANHYRLEQIIKVLYGSIGVDVEVSQNLKTTPDAPPHLCSLSGNLEIIHRKINEENDLIEEIYKALGMDLEEMY